VVSILIDDSLLLRSLQPRDADELFSAVNTSREHLRPWMPWVDMTTKPEHSLHHIQQSLVQQNNQEAIALGIIYQRKLVGCVGMHNWDHNLKKAQLGYWIADDYSGKGISHTSLKSFIGFLFEKAGLNKLEIQFMVTNRRSAAVAEKLGFIVEGVIRQSYILNGAYHHLVLTGLLKTEWSGWTENIGKEFRPT